MSPPGTLWFITTEALVHTALSKVPAIPCLCRLVEAESASKPKAQFLDQRPKLAWLLKTSNQLAEDNLILQQSKEIEIYNEFG